MSAPASTPSSWQSFMLLLGEYRNKYLALTLCAALTSGVEALLHPLLMRAIFDTVSLHADFGNFLYLVAGYLGLGVALNVVGYLLSLWELKIDNQIVAQASSRLLAAYFAKDYRTILENGSGYYVARIRSDVKDGLVPMLTLVRTISANVVMFTTLVGVLVFIAWKAFLILSVIIPVATLVSIVVSKKIRGLTILERDREAVLVNTLTRSVGAFKLVCMFGMVPKTVATFSESVDTVLDSGYKKFRVLRRLQGASDLTMVISDSCSIFVGALFVFRNQMTLGSFIAFMNAFWRSATTLIAIFQRVAELQSHSATVNRLVAFLHEVPDAPSRQVAGPVSATGISYAYGDTSVLNDFSMHLAPGTRALIVGANGSGKTTLANILAGYLQPLGGQLELPAKISAVTLPVHFPPLTVRVLDIDQDLLTLFGVAHPDILDAYPDQLSAGQQQKISLALALSKDADLYVLDEPLANLDLATRAIAMTEIWRRTHGRTLVMIMHGAGEYTAVFDKLYPLGSETPGTPSKEAALNH